MKAYDEHLVGATLDILGVETENFYLTLWTVEKRFINEKKLSRNTLQIPIWRHRYQQFIIDILVNLKL